MQLYHNGSECAAPIPNPIVWKIFLKVSDNYYIMYRNDHGRIRYAPLFIKSIKFINNRCLIKSQTFLNDAPTPEMLETVSDKLKWYRINCGLLQSEVARAMGVNRTTYARYEGNGIQAYPLDKLSKAAELFGIEVSYLFDEYHLFIYRNQGQQIKKLRKALSLTQSMLADILGVDLSTLKRWEQNQLRIPRKHYNQLIKIGDVKF